MELRLTCEMKTILMTILVKQNEDLMDYVRNAVMSVGDVSPEKVI